MTRPPPIDLMIVGAPRAGTTTLKNMLGAHPSVGVHPQREMSFFASEDGWKRGYAGVFPRFFGHVEPDSAALVAKSVAMMYAPVSLERLHAHNPDVRVVVSLREPVARAYSEFWFARRQGKEPLSSFEEALEAGPERFGGDEEAARRCAYLDRSEYHRYVEGLFDVLGRDRVRVVLAERLWADPVAVAREVLASLPAVDPDFVPAVPLRDNGATRPRSVPLAAIIGSSARAPRARALARGLMSERARRRWRERLQRLNDRPFRPPPLPATLRARLEEHFRPCNERLAELLGWDAAPWSAEGRPGRPSAAGAEAVPYADRGAGRAFEG